MVLVTGAAGFIGMHTCERLLARGLAVVGVDNLNANGEGTLEAWVGFRPSTPVRVGVQRFVDWYLRYHGLAAPRTNDPVNRP